MGYVLLSLEHIAFWTLLGALVGLGLKRWRFVSSRRWLTGLATAVAFTPLLCLTSLAWAVHLGWLRTGGFGGDSRPLPLAPSVVLAASIVWILALAFAAAGCWLCLRRAAPDQGDERRRPVGALALALAGVALLHAMTFWNLDLTARQQLESLRVEAGALAVSLSPPVVIDSENAAVVYQETFESGLLDKEPPQYAKWFELYAESPSLLPVDDPEFTHFVSGRTALVQRIRRAAEIPSCNFRRDWGRPSFAMLLPETQNLRACARELILHAHYRASKGEVRDALGCVASLHRVADHAGQEPIIISQLVSIAIEHMAVQSLEHILRTCPITEEDLAVLGDWPLHSHTIRSQSALRMEEAFGLASVSLILTQPEAWPQIDPSFPSPPAPLAPLYRVFFLGSDLAQYQQSMNRMQNTVVAANYAGRRATAEDLEKSLKSQGTGMLSSVFLPAFGLYNKAIGRADARQRLARLAIALHRHRLRQGKFPESLEEIRDQMLIPRDPFDDHPLRLGRRDGRLVLYSIGANLKDDGGQPEVPPSRRTPPSGLDEGDVVFWLE